MHVQLRAAKDDGTLIALDLYRWLRQDPEVRHRTPVTRGTARPGDGTMGAVEVIDLVLGQTFTALNLALAYAAWRTARPSGTPVTITAEGRSITVTGADEETVARIAAHLRPEAEDACG
ncbi:MULTISPECIES: effector-associated constant component EACC1 [Streptomyces]|jgi:hypothetical protein|uniref:Uncharacterized protein n=1 Tax=Streptomyces spinosisporus TaxID=2927582 RepID=A0ABS9XDP8_9ACTN|nr:MULTISPECIES: hypothetical protein [Streptomyces]EPD58866.1 hypothetical protein HMPREF1211_05805 [Streptomyces sp. HGB0020]MCI3240214.1 hypothetical protein [Streptomyces spinosisporus]